MTTITKTVPDEQTETVSAFAAKLNRIKARKPLERSYTLLDEDLIDAAERAEEETGRQMARARAEAHAELDDQYDVEHQAELVAAVEVAINKDTGVRKARKTQEAAQKAAEDAEEKLWLRAIGATAFEDLVTLCPPTAEQAKRGEDYNIKRFAPLLIAACCTEEMTPADAASLVGGEVEVIEPGKASRWDKIEGCLNQGEASMLFSLAGAVNQNARVHLGKD
jgi:hypothetical protein